MGGTAEEEGAGSPGTGAMTGGPVGRAGCGVWWRFVARGVPPAVVPAVTVRHGVPGREAVAGVRMRLGGWHGRRSER